MGLGPLAREAPAEALSAVSGRAPRGSVPAAPALHPRPAAAAAAATAAAAAKAENKAGNKAKAKAGSARRAAAASDSSKAWS